MTTIAKTNYDYPSVGCYIDESAGSADACAVKTVKTRKKKPWRRQKVTMPAIRRNMKTQLCYLNQREDTCAVSPTETPNDYDVQRGPIFDSLDAAQAHCRTAAGIGQPFMDEDRQWSELVVIPPFAASTMKLIHNEMEYSIYERDGKFDVEDAGGSRPIGLRDVGPWKNEAEAADAVRNMTPEDAIA